jgi:hypothetical protein
LPKPDLLLGDRTRVSIPLAPGAWGYRIPFSRDVAESTSSVGCAGLPH